MLYSKFNQNASYWRLLSFLIEVFLVAYGQIINCLICGFEARSQDDHFFLDSFRSSRHILWQQSYIGNSSQNKEKQWQSFSEEPEDITFFSVEGQNCII